MPCPNTSSGVEILGSGVCVCVCVSDEGPESVRMEWLSKVQTGSRTAFLEFNI